MADNATAKPDEAKRMPGLLVSVFEQMRKENEAGAKAQEKIIDNFANRLDNAFDEVHSDAVAKERLLDEKLGGMEREQKYKLQRVRLLTIPATVIALACLVYLFYTVHIIESSMTSMTKDIHHMSGTMQNIGGDTRTMAENTGAMNNNIGHLNRNVGAMGRDVGQMSNSPVMGGMRNFMPF